jgi:hypothetical protein
MEERERVDQVRTEHRARWLEEKLATGDLRIASRMEDIDE